MVIETNSGLQTRIDVLSQTGKEYDMKISVKKTKVIRVCRDENQRENAINLTIYDQVVEKLKQFVVCNHSSQMKVSLQRRLRIEMQWPIMHSRSECNKNKNSCKKTN